LPDGLRLPDGPSPTTARKLDLLFMIDNSTSMQAMQSLLVTNIPVFMEVLKGLPGGLPSLHVAVVSSSMGAGIFGDVPGCYQLPEQSDDGRFRHEGVNPPGCTPPQGSFLVSDASGNNNFTGDISDAFSCIAAIGDRGCGFEHPFASVRRALERALTPGDENYGFLRADAYLGVVLVTNEDDCSVPSSSTLFDPRQSHVADPLGGLNTGYRCQEFGHLCGGQKPPHTVAGDTPLTDCRSAEDGVLIPVADFRAFLRSVKANPDHVSVAALAGPVEPYVVELRANVFTSDGSTESQPAIAHSCGPRMVPGGSQTVFADPSVRIKQLVDGFGARGTFASICSADFRTVVQKVAELVAQPLGPAGR
jgi:hypothetical protein